MEKKTPDRWLTVLSYSGVDSEVDVEEEKEGNGPGAEQPEILIEKSLWFQMIGSNQIKLNKLDTGIYIERTMSGY